MQKYPLENLGGKSAQGKTEDVTFEKTGKRKENLEEDNTGLKAKSF